MLNRFFAIVVAVVAREGGWVNKFEGDAALCIFGAPVPQADHGARALGAAAELPSALAKLPGSPRAGVGVATGTALAGYVGTPDRHEYTVIGEPVNEAARLAELARSEPSRALASAATIAAASEREQRFWRLGRPVRLRGYDERVRIASLVGGP